MIVVGGTYRERSGVPFLDQIAGSGLRAALISDRVADEVELVSAVADDERDGVIATINAFGLPHRLLTRSERVEFSYFTPLGPPVIVGRQSTIAEPVTVDADQVLAFGLVESHERSVRAQRAVVDPQQPVGLRGDPFADIVADERALVLNAHEAAQLSGERRPDIAASALRDRFGAAAVVVKNGARGAVIAAGGHVAQVPPFWSERVAPLGTGDCFSAVFAARWTAGGDPVDAAREASMATSQYTAQTDVAPPRFDGTGTAVPVNEASVYLASPFFTLPQRWLVELCRDLLGPFVFSPLHEVGPGGNEVAQADIDGLERCDAVFAIVEGNDPGTLFETGWAAARGIPVIAYAGQPDTEGAKMIVGLGGELHEDLATALYRSVWHAMTHRQRNDLQ